jgi:hypothetical protein
MKKLLSAFLVLAGLGIMLSACKQDPQSANGPQTVLPLSSNTPPANPALTFSTVPDSGYEAVAVSDSDGSHVTNIYYPHRYSLYQGYMVGCESWSPSGGSIAFVAYWSPDTLYTMDVTVNSQGVPVGKNLKHLYVSTAIAALGTAWSSTTTMGKIAFWEYTSGPSTWRLKVIPQSGGTAKTVYTTTSRVNGVTWSPDDSRLATIRIDSNAGFTVKILGTTDNGNHWAEVDSVAVYNNQGIREEGQSLEWSRSGLNKIALTIWNGSSTHLYYCDPTRGATPTTDGVATGGARNGSNHVTWSPNNSSIIYPGSAGGMWKVSAFTTNTSEVSSSLGAANWNR